MSFVIGLLTGIFSGLLGIGGGVILVPLIVHFYKLMQRQAQAISMTVMVFTGMSGTFAYASNGAIDYFAVLILVVGAVLTTRVGVMFSQVLAEWKLKRAFGFFLIAVSIILIARPYMTPFSFPLTSWGKGIVLLLVGISSGFLSGMMGVGGGSIMIPAMVLLVGMNQAVAQGNSLLCIVPTSAMGAFMHWRLGNVKGALLPGLISGIFLGAYVGGSLACHFPEGILRSVFAVILIVRGIFYVRTVSPEFVAD